MPLTKNQKYAIIAVVLCTALFLHTTGLFTTIYNEATGNTDVLPDWNIYAKLEDGTQISQSNLPDATISGITTFHMENTGTEEPYPGIIGVHIKIVNQEGTPEYSLEDNFYQVESQWEYTYTLDTTTIPNGEYTITFSYTTEDGFPGFTVLTLNFDFFDGKAIGQGEDNTWLYFAGAGIIIVGLVLWYKRK